MGGGQEVKRSSQPFCAHKMLHRCNNLESCGRGAYATTQPQMTGHSLTGATSRGLCLSRGRALAASHLSPNLGPKCSPQTQPCILGPKIAPEPASQRGIRMAVHHGRRGATPPTPPPPPSSIALHCQGGLQWIFECGPVVLGVVPKDGPGTAVHSCWVCWWAGLLTTARKEDTPPWTECEYSGRRCYCNELATNGAERRRYYGNALQASHALVS